MGFVRNLMTGGLILLVVLVCTGTAMAHPHEEGLNPFHKKDSGVSLHCLLNKHDNHLLTKHCPHAKSGNSPFASLYSACGQSSNNATVVDTFKILKTPIPEKIGINHASTQPVFLLQSHTRPLAPDYEHATPPPQATL